MRNKLFAGAMLAILLISMFTLALNIQPVEASGTIVIEADGLINPPSANITSSDNITYTFTGNIYDEIVVERSNIVVDGNGTTLEGLGSGNGFYLSSVSNVTIQSTNIKNFDTGVYLIGSSNNTVSGNNITNNTYRGVHLSASSNDNTVSGNNITNNPRGVWLDQSSNNTFYHNNFINNTQQVYIQTPGYTNFWDNGYPHGGNYWSDYNGTDFYSGSYQNAPGSDGIGDTPHTIDENNQDNYPLMSPHEYWCYPMLCDINKDMKVDHKDLFELAAAYGSTLEKPNWNLNCDFNKDYKIEALDLFNLSKKYGTTVP